MKQEEILKLAASYTQKVTGPFDSDRIKQAASSGFVAGFAVAHGFWQAEWLKQNKQKKLQADAEASGGVGSGGQG